jgi:hypothetical protein
MAGRAEDLQKLGARSYPVTYICTIPEITSLPLIPKTLIHVSTKDSPGEGYTDYHQERPFPSLIPSPYAPYKRQTPRIQVARRLFHSYPFKYQGSAGHIVL